MGSTLLFLCTGNYYRSRYAEILFNSQASSRDLDWKATSRGLALKMGVNNIGPMNVTAAGRLEGHGISDDGRKRFPIPVHEEDLARADLVIAIDEQEHRPYLEERFPDWPDRVRYWHVHDLDLTSADDALPAIEREVDALVRRLTV